jgi:hypothetical protein
MKMKVNKMNNYKVLIQSLILFCVVKMNAQELLTIEDAVKIALENNYAIKIAANELTIGKRMYLLVMQVCYQLQHQLLIIIILLTFHKLSNYKQP